MNLRQIRTSRLLIPVAVVLLASCMTVGPDFQKPEAAVADNWLEAGDPRVETATSEYRDWWNVFDDPVLTRLIEMAYEQNLSLQIAGLKVMQARANLGIAIGSQYPQQQTVSGGYAYSKASRNAPPLANLPDDVASRIDTGVSEWNASFDATWEADVWGKFRRGIEAADASLYASMLDYDALLVTLTGDVAALYANLRTYQQRLVNAQQNVKLQQESLNISRIRFELGATSELDVEQAQSLLSNTQAAIPLLELGISQTINALNVLLGMPPNDLKDILGPGGRIPDAPPTVAVGMPADLLRRRPDIRAAEMNAAAQSAVIGYSQADLYPQFGLAGSIGVAGATFSDQFRSGSVTGFIAPFFSWNIFNYGRIKNNVRAQDALFEQAVLAYQNSVLNAAQEVENNLQSYLRIQEQVGYLTTAVKAAENASKIALVQYRQGAADYTRVLNTQSSLLQQQDELASARGQVVTSLVATYKAIGGGWQIREGKDYINPQLKTRMNETIDWGDMLEAPSAATAVEPPTG